MDSKGNMFNLLCALMTVFNTIIIFIETVDGPNQHTGINMYSFHVVVSGNSTNDKSITHHSHHNPKYPWLPTAEVYEIIQIIILFPLFYSNLYNAILYGRHVFLVTSGWSVVSGDSSSDTDSVEDDANSYSNYSDRNHGHKHHILSMVEDGNGNSVAGSDVDSGIEMSYRGDNHTSSSSQHQYQHEHDQEENKSSHKPSLYERYVRYWSVLKILEVIGLIAFVGELIVYYCHEVQAYEYKKEEDRGYYNQHGSSQEGDASSAADSARSTSESVEFSSMNASNTAFSFLQLLLLARCYAFLRTFPEIRVVERTFVKCIRLLLLPWALLLLVSVLIGGVLLYLEPCYNIYENHCMWVDLVDAVFYSLSTIATVGYGNQVPGTLWGRVVAVSAMLLGALFLALPLAIVRAHHELEVADRVRAEESVTNGAADGIDSGCMGDSWALLVRCSCVDGDVIGSTSHTPVTTNPMWLRDTPSQISTPIPIAIVLEQQLQQWWWRSNLPSSSLTATYLPPVKTCSRAHSLLHRDICCYAYLILPANLLLLYELQVDLKLLLQRLHGRMETVGESAGCAVVNGSNCTNSSSSSDNQRMLLLFNRQVSGSSTDSSSSSSSSSVKTKTSAVENMLHLQSCEKSVYHCQLPCLSKCTDITTQKHIDRLVRYIECVVRPVVCKQYSTLAHLYAMLGNLDERHKGKCAGLSGKIVTLRNVIQWVNFNRKCLQSMGDIAAEGCVIDEEGVSVMYDSRRVRGRSKHGSRYTSLSMVPSSSPSPSPIKQSFTNCSTKPTDCSINPSQPRKPTPLSTYEWFIVLIVLLSMVTFALTTLPFYQETGEASLICESAVAAYCQGVAGGTITTPTEGDAVGVEVYHKSHKEHHNPGCFVIQPYEDTVLKALEVEEGGDVSAPVLLVTSKRLRFFCGHENDEDDGDCYGRGHNFGSVGGDFTCQEGVRAVNPYYYWLTTHERVAGIDETTTRQLLEQTRGIIGHLSEDGGVERELETEAVGGVPTSQPTNLPTTMPTGVPTRSPTALYSSVYNSYNHLITTTKAVHRISPFQIQSQLQQETLFTTETHVHYQYAVCNRLECNDADAGGGGAGARWFREWVREFFYSVWLECFLTAVFVMDGLVWLVWVRRDRSYHHRTTTDRDMKEDEEEEEGDSDSDSDVSLEDEVRAEVEIGEEAERERERATGDGTVGGGVCNPCTPDRPVSLSIPPTSSPTQSTRGQVHVRDTRTRSSSSDSTKDSSPKRLRHLHLYVWDVVACLPLLVEAWFVLQYSPYTSSSLDSEQSAGIMLAAQRMDLLSSLPMPPVLKLAKFLRLIRVMKLYRHAEHLIAPLLHALQRSLRRIGMYFMLLLVFLAPCAYLMFVAERGVPCYTDTARGQYCGLFQDTDLGTGSGTGSDSVEVEEGESVLKAALEGIYNGQLLMINSWFHHYYPHVNKNQDYFYHAGKDAVTGSGEQVIIDNMYSDEMIDLNNNVLSLIPNALYGLWFSLVSVTSVGYGDIFPVSYAGQTVAIAVILMGTVYTAIPLNILIDSYMKSMKSSFSPRISVENEVCNYTPSALTSTNTSIIQIRSSILKQRNQLVSCYQSQTQLEEVLVDQQIAIILRCIVDLNRIKLSFTNPHSRYVK